MRMHHCSDQKEDIHGTPKHKRLRSTSLCGARRSNVQASKNGAGNVKATSTIPLAIAIIFLSTSCATTGLAANERQAGNMKEHTEMTPAELGHRFLAMIETIDKFDDLSAESLQRLMDVPFTRDEAKNSGFYVLNSQENWKYNLTYNFDEKFPRYSNVNLEISAAGGTNEANSPPCDLILKNYDDSLKKHGFKPEPTSYNEFGWALSFYYSRNDLYIQIIPQNKALKSPDAPGGTCIEAISLHKLEG
ncbi:hypothetical protein [Xanthomonas sp. LMG 12459]|uniref:hypothetical protein n=2 Tax=unclassified Xanthomonas TaxID=2643310 RepID=UPI0012635E4F|nr:hypothetical protein [Xanthomonas sp. LMG 12459]